MEIESTATVRITEKGPEYYARTKWGGYYCPICDKWYPSEKKVGALPRHMKSKHAVNYEPEERDEP